LKSVLEFDLDEWNIIEPIGLQESYYDYLEYKNIPDDKLTIDGKILKDQLKRTWERRVIK